MAQLDGLTRLDTKAWWNRPRQRITARDRGMGTRRDPRITHRGRVTVNSHSMCDGAAAHLLAGQRRRVGQ